MKASVLNEITMQNIKELSLYGLLKSYQSIADSAVKNELSYVEFLNKALQSEIAHRNEKSKQTLIKFARFPKVKTIDEFDFKSSSVDKTLINDLLSLRFIDEHKNILFCGASGVGKTHLAIAIGYQAVSNKIKTRFSTMSDLMLQLESAKYAGRFGEFLNRVVAKTRLLIIDELGYIKLDKAKADMFFEIINKKYEQGSVIITSNLNFNKWKGVLNDDEALTYAVLDRLIHHSHIVNISGESYRLRDKLKSGILNLSKI